MEFSFTLRFELKEGLEPDRLLKRLAEAGCSHAFMGTGAQSLALRFTREANGAMAAVMDALAEVKSAMPQARLLELSPAFNGHSVEATQVVAATLWLLAQPGQSSGTASLDCLGRPREAVEEIRVSNRYLVGKPGALLSKTFSAESFHQSGPPAYQRRPDHARRPAVDSTHNPWPRSQVCAAGSCASPTAA